MENASESLTPNPESALDPTLPEVVRRFLAGGGVLESIRLDAHGNWWHQNGLFNNARIADLFFRSVDRTEGGTWVLKVGRFTYPIEVEDTGFFVERIQFAGQNTTETVHITLSDHTTEQLDLTSLRYRENRGIYSTIKEGKFRAHFKRPAYYDLLERLEEVSDNYALYIADQHWPLPSL